MPVFQLTEDLVFPPPTLARKDGLLAVGGDLSIPRLLLAYQQGIFPWYSEGDPILWWAPSPRFIIELQEFRKPRRLARLIKQGTFRVTVDREFRQVIGACATVERRQGKGTWITPAVVESFSALHDLGYAHSVECWRAGELAGGIYGLALGNIFFGESMFSRIPNSSKVALAVLAELLTRLNYRLIDCQIKSAHLRQFGAKEIPGALFQAKLAENARGPTRRGRWFLG